MPALGDAISMRPYGDVLEDNPEWVKQMTCALRGHQWIQVKDGERFCSFDVKQYCTHCDCIEYYPDY